jgi:hypothetical protein
MPPASDISLPVLLDQWKKEDIMCFLVRLLHSRTGEKCSSGKIHTPFCLLIIEEEKKRNDQDIYFPIGCRK